MKLLALMTLLACLPWLAACSGGPRPAAAPAPAASSTVPASAAQTDPHSFARPAEVAVDHLALDLGVDFDHRQLNGRALLHLNNKTGADRVVLDTRDLTIRKVTLDDGSEAQFTLGDPVKYLGQPLEIKIKPATKAITVDYVTSPDAAAVQWLTPEQAGDSHPFLFTQSESILARTWVPCQDTPGVRMTYEATVHVPPGLMAVMSAENPTRKSADGVYHFRMPQKIPSYLLALGVGNLEFRPLGNRAGVYALPSVVEKAAWELADTPKMIDAAEKLYGPYRWGRYDLLILPASYPFGGMENPRLTFATPTILAGDRSLVSLVAHELAHSWSGNLVTNATWNDFWLNEGFTTYFEGRIMEAVYGRPYFEMLASLGRQSLEDTMRDLPPADTRLHLDLAGRDPDEGTNDVAYEKGALFLRMLEQSVGRARFDKFLRTYFDTFAFQSITTATSMDYLKKNLLGGDPAKIQALKIDDWINGPGVPANAPVYRPTAFVPVDQAAAAFQGGTPAARLTTQGWNTHQWLHFLHALPTPLDTAKMADLDQAFHLSQSGNSEILDAWLLLAIQSRYEAAYPALDQFLTTVGRRKFLKPLYTELAKTPAGMEMALRIYRKARPGYHSVSQNTIDQILSWKS
jgi:aminopeptidase N